MIDELLAALAAPIRAGDMTVLRSAERDVVNRELTTFPWAGSWPDWKAALNHRHRDQPVGALVERDFLAFFDECLEGRSGEAAFWANDGLPVALRSNVATFRTHLPAFVDMLHTSYFIAADGRWCMTLSTTGTMNYGEAPLR